MLYMTVRKNLIPSNHLLLVLVYSYQQPQQYDQAQRRLDPDQMPNPISVMIENQNSAGGAFVTNEQGLLPPLVTTKYVVQDQGNSSPRYIRSSLYCIPSTADLLKTTTLSFTLTISPMARTVEGEYEPHSVSINMNVLNLYWVHMSFCVKNVWVPIALKINLNSYPT
ncbi:protein transport protein Sec24D-like [Eurosta solidaginis]|uniref:protein transport protein Sec24D-like n=1 Tax=Eurosta solidaginis TaxID=178769 RepID=UPI003530626A